MNIYISNAQLAKLKERFKPGTRVELVKMDDPYRKLPMCSKGTVRCVDDIGTIHVQWDCGASLGVAFGEDLCRVIPTKK